MSPRTVASQNSGGMSEAAGGAPSAASSGPPRRRAPPPGGRGNATGLFRTVHTLTSGDTLRAMGAHRRVTYLMLFRLVLISLVLGATILLSWLSDVDLSAPNSLVLLGIIILTYLLTIVYSVALSRGAEPTRLAGVQLVADLVISALLIHVTGGAQSAYTFFFPLSIIAAATVRFRAGAVVVAVASMVIFSAVAVLGWLDILPSFAGQRTPPSDLTSVELGRAMALNLTAFAAVAVLAYNLGGQIQHTSASLETQRTRAADLRALSEDIVRCLSSGLITVDDRGTVLTCNRVACEILGLEPAQVAGQPMVAILPELAEVLDALGERDDVRRVEIETRLPGRARAILGLSLSPLRNNRDEVIGRIINFHDLTEIREMEAHMRRAERLAVVGTLAAGVAHEIRNPLAAISGSIELLRADPRTDDDGRTLMQIVTREVDRLNGLITDLLDYTNPQPRELLSFDLAELIRETVTVFEQDRDLGDISVELDIAPARAAPEGKSAVDIVADPGRIRQVIWNLLRNAAAAAERAITVRVEEEGGDTVIEVSDDGHGITAEILPRVFDPFFTTKKRGTGLGLATCHSIVTEHGGEISVDSAPGQGCTFTVRLPRAASERSQPDPEAPQAVVALGEPGS